MTQAYLNPTKRWSEDASIPYGSTHTDTLKRRHSNSAISRTLSFLADPIVWTRSRTQINLRGMSLAALRHALPEFNSLTRCRSIAAEPAASRAASSSPNFERWLLWRLERFVLALALLLARRLLSTEQLRCRTALVHVSRSAPSRLERGRCRARGGRAPTRVCRMIILFSM